jgi:hypothetical protein
MKKALKSIDVELLRALLIYVPWTGKLYWKRRPENLFATKRAYAVWNTHFAGAEALMCIKSNGYPHGSIFGTRYLAHRVVWALQTGNWPADEIDHVNGIRHDNRWLNLREASSLENKRNMRSDRGTSKHKGVSWVCSRQKWYASVSMHNKTISLGLFLHEEDAAAAYRAFTAVNFGDFDVFKRA